MLTRDDSTLRQLLHALKVMTTTPHIRAYLLAHDPKALEQAEFAIDDAMHDMK